MFLLFVDSTHSHCERITRSLGIRKQLFKRGSEYADQRQFSTIFLVLTNSVTSYWTIKMFRRATPNKWSVRSQTKNIISRMRLRCTPACHLLAGFQTIRKEIVMNLDHFNWHSVEIPVSTSFLPNEGWRKCKGGFYFCH